MKTIRQKSAIQKLAAIFGLLTMMVLTQNCSKVGFEKNSNLFEKPSGICNFSADLVGPSQVAVGSQFEMQVTAPDCFQAKNMGWNAPGAQVTALANPMFSQMMYPVAGNYLVEVRVKGTFLNNNELVNVDETLTKEIVAIGQPSASNLGYCELLVDQFAAMSEQIEAQSPDKPERFTCPLKGQFLGFGNVSPVDFKISYQIPEYIGVACGGFQPTELTANSWDMAAIGQTVIPSSRNSNKRVCVSRTTCEQLRIQLLKPKLPMETISSAHDNTARGILLAPRNLSAQPSTNSFTLPSGKVITDQVTSFLEADCQENLTSQQLNSELSRLERTWRMYLPATPHTLWSTPAVGTGSKQ